MSTTCTADPPPTKRGRGKAQGSLALIDAAKAILQEIQPATIRAVCYQLFNAGLIPNMGKNATGRVSKQLVYARENRMIPWRWIVDETRHKEGIAALKSLEDRINGVVQYYRRDNWQEQTNAVEVWSEKGTVRGTIWPILSQYGVDFRVLHGFGSATTINGVAQASAYSTNPLTVLYVGDWDPSGLCMSEVDIPKRMARYNGKLTVRRIALTADDVAPGTDMPSFSADTKTKDSRYRWFIQHYGKSCWELDAMSPAILRERVESAIQSLLDVDAWNHAVKIEKAEVESMREFGRHWKASISRLGANYSPLND